ncbi:MAG: heavy metal translocating P-type ATPase [Burkholderiaceae bacterium]
MTTPTARKAKVAAAPGDATDDAGVCVHCGDPLAGLKLVRRPIGPVMRSFCCHGCAFIAEQLYLAQSAGREPDRAEPEEAPAQAGARELIEVHGMVCAACGLLIEHRLRRMAGVAQVHVDFGGQRAYVAYDPQRVSRAALESQIRAAGYRTDGSATAERRARRLDLLRVLVAWLVMMQVMMLAVPAYMAAPGEISPDVEQLLRIAQLVLTVPAMLFCAQPLVRAAVSQVRMGLIGMDVPVVFGIGAAFVASVWGTFHADGHVYFDSVTMFVALVLGSRWLQAKGLVAAHAEVDALRRQQTVVAQRLLAFPSSLATQPVVADELVVGERVLVPPGETVPADGLVVDGHSSLSQAWLTGESTPIDRRVGDGVLAGSINLDQPLVVEVTRIGDATALAALRRLVDEAGRERPRIVELANRVAGGFLWVVILITLATVIGWWLVDPSQALPNAIAVLVATCPCALSLAAPAALAAAQSALAARGVLLTRVAAIETLARVDTLACDKTGTITTGEPVLLRQLLLRGDDETRSLAVAAALESLSVHPFARAIAVAARESGLSLPGVAEGKGVASAGVEGKIDGHHWRLGKLEFVLADQPAERARVAQHVANAGHAAASYIVLADDGGAQAVFIFGEALRTGAHALAAAMSVRGVGLMLISGDRREPAQAVGATLGIERVYAHQTPESKRSLVQQEQIAGRCVAMLGDGMNDAPVIAQADVSIALAQGSTLAQARADLLVMSSRLEEVVYSFTLSARAMRIVRQNLGWAFVYNVGIVPAAAFGYVSPAFAAVGMAASSLLVVVNALRARRVPAR